MKDYYELKWKGILLTKWSNTYIRHNKKGNEK
jgi:hypothetical protein